MIEQIFDRDSYKILSLFSLSPGSRFKRNEIKDKTKLNNVTLDKALNRLIYSNILTFDRNYYQLNFSNENSKRMIEVASRQYKDLKELPFNVYLLLIDLIDHLSSIRKIEVYLFGSYSKLIFREKSDIDIAILTTCEANLKKINDISNKLEKKYGKRIEIHDFPKESFYKNQSDPLVKDIIQNGMRLM